MKLTQIAKKFVKDERGLETVEYAIIAALITIAAIGVIGTVGDEVTARFQELVDALTGAEAAAGA
jgi:pilus assembly protein Flp/PilA